jgi:hypothetical protein
MKNVNEEIKRQADKLLERAPQQEAEEVQVPYVDPKTRSMRTGPWIKRKPGATRPKAMGLIKMGEGPPPKAAEMQTSWT